MAGEAGGLYEYIYGVQASIVDVHVGKFQVTLDAWVGRLTRLGGGILAAFYVYVLILFLRFLAGLTVA